MCPIHDISSKQLVLLLLLDCFVTAFVKQLSLRIETISPLAAQSLSD